MTMKRRYEVLEGLIKQNGWTNGAEVGLFKGATFFHLLKTCPDLRLIGVDNWKSTTKVHIKNMDKGLSTWYPPAVIEGHAKDVMSRAKQFPNATVYREDSLSAVERIEDGSLDFVFIDAEHTTEAVFADVTAWRPKVREGGWIIGHDEQWGSVRRALKRLFTAWTVHPDNVWSVP